MPERDLQKKTSGMYDYLFPCDYVFTHDIKFLVLKSTMTKFTMLGF